MSDIFNSTDEQNVPSFEDLVGEGKKYATPDDIAKAKAHADAHIAILEREREEDRQELAKRKTAEELLERIRQEAAQQHAPREEDNTGPAPLPAINEDDVVARVRAELQAERQKEIETKNIEAVAAKLVDVFGDSQKAQEHVKRKAHELGVDLNFLQETASRSPAAFFSTIGLTDDSVKNTSTPTAPRSEVNLNISNQGGVKPGTYAYYAKLRKENPDVYKTAQVQMQMHKDALAKGEAFFN